MENETNENVSGKRNSAIENKELFQNGTYEEIEKELNAKILAITLKIRKDRPELSKFLEEMPVTVSNVKEPHITLNLLKVYYESLVNLFEDYKFEHPDKTI